MRLAPDAAHEFGGIELDRRKPLSFRLDGRRVTGFAGDTVLSAALACGIDTFGMRAGQPLGLGERFAPLIRFGQGEPLPMERTPAIDGVTLSTIGRRRRFGPPQSLRHAIRELADPPWLREAAEETRTVELLVVGGGVAGLAAADAAAAAGHRVLVAERRPWLGGGARYFGAVGDDETPDALVGRLHRQLAARDSVTLLSRAEVVAISGSTALLHQVDTSGPVPRGRVVAVTADRIVLATGAQQRLPVFPGNRLPAVSRAIDAYHLAKRYGVVRGTSAVVATQGNHTYRLALRLHDAGIAIRRIVDTRINPQSRFIDFAKASGLTLSSGQIPLAAERDRFVFAPAAGSGASTSFEAAVLIVAGGWQPDLTLWMRAGGSVRWASERSALVAHGSLEHIALAGSAAGYRSLRACVESGRAAQAMLFGAPAEPIEDAEPGTHLETPDAPTPIAPAGDVPAFLDSGVSLAARPEPNTAPDTGRGAHALSLSDVAASVELGLIAPADAGAIAEERGSPGSDLRASDWRPAAVGSDDPDLPPYLRKRHGDDPRRLHLVVDGKRRFAVGTLVYSVTTPRLPEHAIGAIVASAPVGGIALVSKSGAKLDRFIVETPEGPSPARISRN